MHAVREIEVLGGKATVVVTPDGAVDRLLAMTGASEFLRVSRQPADPQGP